ncbi:XRE family transcriptional regulator [Bradyrhizobium sp. 144]|uniref:XRE family transcriptional regulator n=1 Tax=Bradyrhizobium sp. 144 TaxID=2782620 RepID=UPI001FFA2807|nr:XRE family transcriptional regulator [Bradyrhizobium sp. 144]
MAKAKKSIQGKTATRARKPKAWLTMSFMTDLKGLLSRPVPDIKVNASRIAAKAMALNPKDVRLLVERYGEALEKSSKAGRPFSFRVNVDPTGNAVAAPVEQVTSKESVETGEESDLELGLALAAARDRGRIRAAEILSGKDMCSADELAELLHTTRVTINAKRQNGQLLGLDGATRGFRFPVWQLNRDGKPYPELPALRERLGGPWAIFRFLVQVHDELDGLTGREALERGQGEALLAAAESVGRGDFR